MDGLGLDNSKSYNAFYKAKTPNIDKLFKDYPNNILMASEQHVGLPKKQPETQKLDTSLLEQAVLFFKIYL